MIRTLTLLLFIPFLFSSCNEKPSSENDLSDEPVDNFVVEGKIVDGGNTTLYLEALSQDAKINVASARTDNDGNFKMIGNIPGFGLYQLRLGESPDQIIPLTLVPNDSIQLFASVENFETEPVLRGSKWAETMTRYMKVFSKFHEEQTLLMAKKDSISNEELSKAFIALKNPVDSFAVNEMKKNPGNPFNIVLSSAATPAMGFNSWNPANLDVLKAVSEAYEKEFPDSPIATSMANQVYMIESAYMEHMANNSGTRPAPEIALNDPEGNERKLSDLRGKYVLIDFWASWCGPCRKENPNIVRLYKKFKNKGFTIFSVSLDNDAEAWKTAIEKDGLEWPNHVSDLKQWESPLPQLYGFQGIPHTVLINPEGNIIGVGLRGEELEQKLNELFTKK